MDKEIRAKYKALITKWLHCQYCRVRYKVVPSEFNLAKYEASLTDLISTIMALKVLLK